MRRIFTGIGTVVLAILLAAGLFGCGQKPAEGSAAQVPKKGGKTAVSRDFESIEVTETGTMAFSTVYSCKRTEKGVHVEYYIFQSGWDEEKNVSLDEKRMIHSFDGDEAVYREIADALGTAPVDSWDGFSESNSMVQDGESFSLDMKLGDGSTVSAHGTNAYPEGYREFVNRLDAACATELVKDTTFDTDDFSFKIPESWVGNVYAVYRDGMVGFEVKTKKKDRMILCFYQDSYDYGSGLSDYVPIVSFLKNDETWFIKMRRTADSYLALEEMNSEQQAICKSLNQDMKAIKDSFVLKGGYEIVEEPDTEEERDASYVTGYYTDPNSENADTQDGGNDAETEETEATEENGDENSGEETTEEENGDVEGDTGTEEGAEEEGESEEENGENDAEGNEDGNDGGESEGGESTESSDE